MRIILCFLLSLVAAPAWAEWVKVGESDSSISYIDPDRIRKDGNFRKVWQIQDLKQRHKDGELSRRARLEIDCKEEQNRLLSLSTHSESMAGGETLWSKDGVREWTAIPPDSVAEAALKFVCAK